MVRVAVTIAVLGLTLARPAAVLQQPVFRVGTDLVHFGVTVTDRRGALVTDLTADDFHILEDGQPQTITHFVRGDDVESGPDLHVGLMLDASGSMGDDIQLARTAAIRFLNALPHARDITLVDFDTEVRMATFGQQHFPQVVERIRSRKPAGWTALYDALGVYLGGAAGNEGRTILVLYTDGGDTRSTLRLRDAMAYIRESDVTIYAIGFMEHQPARSRTEQRLRLAQIAEEAGGEAFFPRSMRDIEAAYDRILEQVRSQYSLGYLSTSRTADGRWREVDVQVRRPDLGNARVRTRSGYFAPYENPQ